MVALLQAILTGADVPPLPVLVAPPVEEPPLPVPVPAPPVPAAPVSIMIWFPAPPTPAPVGLFPPFPGLLPVPLAALFPVPELPAVPVAPLRLGLAHPITVRAQSPTEAQVEIEMKRR